MTSLSQIKKQIEELQQKAAEIEATEKQAVIQDVLQKIADYGLTPADLGLEPRAARARTARTHPSAKPAAPRYKGPDGQLWSGGRGRKPQWVRDLLDAGGDLEKHRIRNRKSA
ncbi:H-NS family nucleoid-associated regulatory protein [Ramlibacter sp.]|uniref:H-NS histone family protein n=1 Tax=Ramlibacter sp. TaxID=1917967 RepID=UPI003D110992